MLSLSRSDKEGADNMTTVNVDDKGLPKDQLDLIQHFEADYNSIDQFLRKALESNKQVLLIHSESILA